MAHTHYMKINAEDGQHFQGFSSEQAALKALAKQTGRALDKVTTYWTYLDDFGRRLIVKATPSGVTVAELKKAGPAYDAREWGVATKAQLNLLNKLGY